jgi:hypothetical protein
MLAWLRQRARTEVRVKVMLAIGTIFSAELAEQVFEYALLAEELPVDPTVCEAIMVDPPDCVDEAGTARNHITDPRPCAKATGIYTCQGVLDERPISVFWDCESVRNCYVSRYH